MVDYTMLANDFGKPQSQYPDLYVGDISGPNGIPDGFVDWYDVSAFSSEWLNETE
jgi:hypothetical protein